MSHRSDLQSTAETSSPAGGLETSTPPKDRGPAAFGIVALVACCGVKVLLLAGFALSAGSAGVLVGSVALGLVGVAGAVTVIVFGRRRRQRCESACDAPEAPGAAGLASSQERVPTH